MTRDELLTLLRDHAVREELVSILAEAMVTADEARIAYEEAQDKAEATQPPRTLADAPKTL